jgi:hypothetical protein
MCLLNTGDQLLADRKSVDIVAALEVLRRSDNNQRQSPRRAWELSI